MSAINLTLVNSIASKLSADTEFTTDMDNYAEATEHVKNKGVHYVRADLKRLFGDAVYKEWPKPDSESGNNPDWVKVKNPNGGKDRSESFYFTLIDQLGFASKHVAEIEELSKARSEKEGAKPELLKLGKAAIDGRISLERQRITAWRSLVKTAVKLEQQWCEIEANMPKVYLGMMMEADNPTQVRNTPKPILIADKSNLAETSKAISVSTFLRYKPDVALAKDGTVEALRATAQRGPREGQASGTEVNIQSTEDFGAVLSDVLHYTGKKGWRAETIHAILETEAGNDLLVNLYNLEQVFDQVLGTKTKSGKTLYAMADDMVTGEGKPATTEAAV